jgi:hypothetical protein
MSTTAEAGPRIVGLRVTHLVGGVVWGLLVGFGFATLGGVIYEKVQPDSWRSYDIVYDAAFGVGWLATVLMTIRSGALANRRVEASTSTFQQERTEAIAMVLAGVGTIASLSVLMYLAYLILRNV